MNEPTAEDCRLRSDVKIQREYYAQTAEGYDQMHIFIHIRSYKAGQEV